MDRCIEKGDKMLNESNVVRDLGWVARRVGVVVGLLLLALFLPHLAHLSENLTILLSLALFIFAHLWLLAWLTFAIRPMYHQGVLVSIQIRWRESNKVLTHVRVNYGYLQMLRTNRRTI